jgi:hypothetical protein
VTIGIAVKPMMGDFIVTVSDQRQSFSDVVSPVEAGALKVAQIASTWGFLFAGGQMGYARTIAQKARIALNFAQAPKENEEQRTFDEVRFAVSNAYSELVDEIMFHRYIRRYGFSSIQDFSANSHAKLGSKVTERLSNKIDAFELGMELLVFGFNEGGAARFLQITDHDIADQSVVNAWAVGTGFYLAMASLNVREIQEQSIHALVYRACEAKFCAEYADAVGKTTSVCIWYPSGRFSILAPNAIAKLRDMWEAARKSPIPPGASTVIDKALERDVEFRGRAEQWRLAQSSGLLRDGVR